MGKENLAQERVGKEGSVQECVWVFSPPQTPQLLSLRVIWNHSTKHHFFFFLGGVGGGGRWSCTACGILIPRSRSDFLPSAVEAWRTHPWTTSKVPVSVPSIRFASFGRICTQSHSYDDELVIVIQTFLINYHCLLRLENFSFWKYLQSMRREWQEKRIIKNLFASWKFSLKPSFQLKWLSSSPIHSLTVHHTAAVPMLGCRKTNAMWPPPSKFIIWWETCPCAPWKECYNFV